MWLVIYLAFGNVWNETRLSTCLVSLSLFYIIIHLLQVVWVTLGCSTHYVRYSCARGKRTIQEQFLPYNFSLAASIISAKRSQQCAQFIKSILWSSWVTGKEIPPRMPHPHLRNSVCLFVLSLATPLYMFLQTSRSVLLDVYFTFRKKIERLNMIYHFRDVFFLAFVLMLYNYNS